MKTSREDVTENLNVDKVKEIQLVHHSFTVAVPQHGSCYNTITQASSLKTRPSVWEARPSVLKAWLSV